MSTPAGRDGNDAIVRIADIHKAFGAVEVLRGISFDVAKGEAVCIIGPSGSGKSTLLRCINGLAGIDRGEIFVGPHAVHRLHRDSEMVALRKDVSIVFQQYNLFPHRTALQNVMMAPVQVLRQPKDEVESRARALLGFQPTVEFEDGLAELAEWLDGQSAEDHVEEAREQLAARGLTV